MTLASLFRSPFRAQKCLAPPVGVGAILDVSDARPDVRLMIRNHQYFQVLDPQDGIEYDSVSIDCAWRAVEHEMALVPQGESDLRDETAISRADQICLDPDISSKVNVDAFYIDRTCVTNAQYKRFVDSGCYSDPDLWPEEILPLVIQFVDQSGCPGPSLWCDGRPDKNLLDHPVVGISWYEANAYAKSIGKRLPTSPEWQRAGTWGRSLGNAADEVHYPWGNSFDKAKSNLWVSGLHHTVPVTDYSCGDTSNGVRQLIGNVWEWANTLYAVTGIDGVEFYATESMAEIRGGAFDTYFHTQATCQFRTGQPLSCRRSNIGFRCCRGLDGLPTRQLADSVKAPKHNSFHHDNEA